MSEKLKLPVLYTFGTGDLFFTLMINMEVFFFTAFLTDFAQFSLITVNLILYITGAADIICALVAGFILQRVTLRFGGKFRSWLLVGPPIVAPLFILQFSKIGGDFTAALIITLGFIAGHLVFNVVFAATGSMVGTMTQIPNERTILSSSRAQGMAAAGLIFSVTPLMIAFFSARTNDVLAHTLTTAVYAILMIVGYYYIYRITAGKDISSEKPAPVAEPQNKQPVKEIVGLVFKNPPLLFLMIADTFRNTSQLVVGAWAFYYFGYVLNNPGFLSAFILAIHVAALFGTLVATWVGVKIGKRNSYWVFLVLGAFSFVLALFLGKATWEFTIIFSIGYMFCLAAGAMSTALFVDSSVYGEWKTGKSIQGFTMALLTLPIKVGILLRSGIIGLGLIVIGFDADVDVTQSVVDGIRSIMIFAPAVACAISAVTFKFGYRINDEDILRMKDEIAAR